MTQLERRIKQLEAAIRPNYAGVVELIRSGCFYDELTDGERDEYCRYHEVDRGAAEAIELCVNGNLHFPLKTKERPLTPDEFVERVLWVEQMIKNND